MTPRPPLPPGPYLVVGLARSGMAAARMLAPHGEVIGVDSGAPSVDAASFEAHLGVDGVELLDRVATVVKSPGVPREAPVVAEALERGIEVTGELELAWRLLPNPFVAVTGTNGKTTTVELLGAIWRAAGLPVAVAGNVGTPLASLVGEVEPDATVIARGVELPARGRVGVRARVRGAAERGARPPRPPRRPRALPRGEDAALRPRAGRTR